MTFDNWQCNLPTKFPNNTRIRAAYFSQVYRERILVLSQSRFNDGVETWTYRLESDSWELIHSGTKNTPPDVRVGSIFVTVCQNKVLYIPSSSSIVWLFDGLDDRWSSRSLRTGPGVSVPVLTDEHSTMFFALFDETSNHSFSCECGYVVIGISAVKRLWSIRCDDTGRYVWTQIIAKPSWTNEYPEDLVALSGAANAEEGFILVMANNGLWKYFLSSNRWRRVGSKILFGTRDYHPTVTAGFFIPHRELYYLLMDDKILRHYLSTPNDWDFYDLEGTLDYRADYKFVAIATRTFRFLLYGGGFKECKTLMWELEMYPSAELAPQYILQDPPMAGLSPLITKKSKGVVNCIFVGDMLWVLVPTREAEEKQNLELWQLHLASMTWTLLTRKILDDKYFLEYNSASVQAAVFYGNTYFMLYASPGSEFTRIIRYNSRDLEHFLKLPYVKVDRPEGRTGSCISSLNDSTIILFGGKTLDKQNFRYLHDLWLATLSSPESSNLKWTEVKQEYKDNSTVPLGRESYQCAIIDQTLFVVGGIVGEDVNRKQVGVNMVSCYRDVWQFALKSGTWSHIFVDDSKDRSMCIVSAATVGRYVVATSQSRNNIPGSEHRSLKLWIYDSSKLGWILHSDMVSSDTFYPFFWRGRIFLFQRDSKELSYKDLFCPAGFTSFDISKDVCKPCPIGSYSEGLGEKSCTQCPTGLTTASTESRSLRNCTHCVDDYCKYGKCSVVLLANGEAQPRCQCRLGFSGVKCQNPRDILVSLAVSLFIAGAMYGLLFAVGKWKKKKLRERSLLHHVEELTNVWQIKEKEITQLQVIGSGGYGVVYKVKYRDMFAAMKVLRQPADDAFMWEFEREIKFMQTVRHPNIILFLGAGRTRDGAPFIVSEFVSRGSLRELLDDQTQDIPLELQVKFALDIARGMSFLHSLFPPRIHRDLKSDNLLVSEMDIVKITDFGLGKQISAPLSRQQGLITRFKFWKKSSNSQYIPSTVGFPLLQQHDRESPHALGAARWRAPEISNAASSEHDAKSADVYSFAVVLWEIVTRQLPFRHYDFNYEVVSAVRSGERPAFPGDSPSVLALKPLIQDCWQTEPTDRPSFGVIKKSLKQIYESLS
jgi:hypothetical protein